MTIDELYKLFNEHKKEVSIEQSYEDMLLEKCDLIENALRSDYNLAKQCFSTCTLDFFIWFTKDISLIDDIVISHKNCELLQVLNDHIKSFNDKVANEFLEQINQEFIRCVKNK